MAKILIVDDEPNIVMALEYALKRKGFIVLIARNGKEAFQACKTQQPCLMVLDIMMPEMDGYEVLKKIKQTDSLSSIKTIILSAKNKPEDIEKGKLAGAVDYVKKPFSTKKLIEKISNYCKT